MSAGWQGRPHQPDATQPLVDAVRQFVSVGTMGSLDDMRAALERYDIAHPSQAPPVHLVPDHEHAGAVPCCGKPLSELPAGDRLTTERFLVTCGGPSAPVPDGGHFHGHVWHDHEAGGPGHIHGTSTWQRVPATTVPRTVQPPQVTDADRPTYQPPQPRRARVTVEDEGAAGQAIADRIAHVLAPPVQPLTPDNVLLAVMAGEPLQPRHILIEAPFPANLHGVYAHVDDLLAVLDAAPLVLDLTPVRGDAPEELKGAYRTGAQVASVGLANMMRQALGRPPLETDVPTERGD